MSRNAVITVIVVLVLIIGVWMLTRPGKQVVQTPQATETPISTDSASPSDASAGATAMTEQKNLVKISSDGFTPKSITIKLGDPITWTNVDTENHTVSSDNHPTHLLYPFLNLGIIKPGENKSLTPARIGTFTYHDHLNPSRTGIITVQ